MGREVRMVPPGWQHPTEWGEERHTGQMMLQHRALKSGDYARELAEWDEAADKWEAGQIKDYSAHPATNWKPKGPDHKGSYAEYAGDRPRENDYMPTFSEGSATHLMMYETTSEGTPISPAFTTPEQLARWLTDNNASAFGDQGASYEHWLSVAKSGWAPSMVVAGGRLMSGVEAVSALTP